MDKCPFRAGDTITAIETVGSSITKGKDYIVQEISLGYVRIANNAGQVGGWMPSRFKLAKPNRNPNQVREGDVLIAVCTGSGVQEGRTYYARQSFTIPSDTSIDHTTVLISEKPTGLGFGVFPWRVKLKEDEMSQQNINVGDTLVVRSGKGTPNLPDGAEVNVLNVSGGNTSVQVLNTNGRKEWYGVERFKLQTQVQASNVGKTFKATHDHYPLKVGDTFVVTGQRAKLFYYTYKGVENYTHPIAQCVEVTETEVVRKKDNFGHTIFEVGDRARFKHNGKEIVVTKTYNHDDTSQTVYYNATASVDNGSLELINETETSMTQSRTPTTKNPSGAIAGDTVLVEGVLTRGPDGDNEFVIKLGTKDAFVPAQAIKSITKKAVVGPKFKQGDVVKMNSARVSYTDTRKRGTVLFEKNGVYFIEWTGGELGSSKETNSIKEQSLLAA